MTKKHSAYGPSAAERWMACPASVRLTEVARERDLLDEGPSVYAEMGTYAMEILEAALRSGSTVQEAFQRHSRQAPDGFGEDDLRALAAAEARIREVIEGADEWGVEERVDIFPALGVWGTCDVWARHGDKVTVVDYKHGAGVPVRAHGNMQLALYAIGLAERFPQAKTFRLAIFQPRAAGWSEATVGLDFLAPVAAEAKEAILFDIRSLKIGQHCRWCPAALVCPARLKEAKELMAMDETSLDDAETLRRVIEAGPRVEALVQAAKKAAIRRLMTGAEIKGLTLKTGPGRLAWLEGAEGALREAFGDAAFEVVTRSPAKVRDTLPGGREFVEKWAEKRPGYLTVEVVDMGAEA